MEDEPDRVAIIELTDLMEISLGQIPAWTLGLDAIGPKHQLEEVLAFAVDGLMENYPGPELTEENCAGYPKWLLQSAIEP